MNLFDLTETFEFLKNYSIQKQKPNTLKALLLIQELHKNQFRKEGTPFVIHPMSVAMDAITLGLDDDNLLATALLHDVEEDCGVNTEDLGFNDTITHSVHLLTKRKVPKDQKQAELNRYFHDLQTDKNAIIVKLLDRKNNLSTMVHAFSYEKMKEYVIETKTYCIPLLKITQKYPDLNNFYHIIKGFYYPFLESFEYQDSMIQKEKPFQFQKRPQKMSTTP